MTGETGPILIGGLSHSGKTPLRMVLGAHPELSLTRRTRLWDHYYGRFGDLGRPDNLERCLTAIARDAALQPLEPDPPSIRREFLQGAPTYGRLFGCVHRQHAERQGKRRWGDQLKFVERFADPIFAAFPTARMVHMIRDPRARTASARADARGRPGSVGLETAMWRCSARLARLNRSRYPGRYRIVRYEEFRHAPEATVQDLCAFLGEEFVPSMSETLGRLRFEPADPVPSPDGPAAADVAFIQRYARRELRCLGYDADPAPLDARPGLRSVLVEWPVNRAAMAAHDLVGTRVEARGERR